VSFAKDDSVGQRHFAQIDSITLGGSQESVDCLQKAPESSYFATGLIPNIFE